MSLMIGSGYTITGSSSSTITWSTGCMQGYTPNYRSLIGFYSQSYTGDRTRTSNNTFYCHTPNANLYNYNFWACCSAQLNFYQFYDDTW